MNPANYYFFIKQIIARWKAEAGVFEPIHFKHTDEMDDETCEILKHTIKIFTSRPGLLIGRYGKLVEKYREIFKEYYHGTDVEIEFIETNDWV